MVSDDPEFEKKAARIMGLYLKPPAKMKKAPSKPVIVSIPSCRSLRVGPNVTGRNTFATVLFLSMRP
jgi:hypothetical protein